MVLERMRAWAAAPLLLLATGLTGCYVDAGDYVVFRVAVSEVTTADGCYTEDDPRPPEEALSSNSYFAPVTWVVYYGAGDRVVIDADGLSLGGEETSDGFSFLANTIDVDYRGIDNLEAKVTINTETTITIEQSGSAVSGEFLAVETTTCDFLTATPTAGLCQAVSNCERRAQFAGVELDDVILDSGVDRPNPL